MTEYRSVLYSFTVTLKPILYSLEANEQYDVTYSNLVRLLKNLNVCITMVSEYTKCFNIHFHGIIQFKTPNKNHMKQFYDLFRKNKLFGFVNIRQIDDLENWIKYMKKDLHEFTDRRPIIIDEFGEFLTGFEKYLCYDLQDEQ